MTTALKTKKTAAKKETKKTAAKKETKTKKSEIKTEPVNLEKIDLTKTEVSEAVVSEGDTMSEVEVEVANDTEVSEAVVETAPDDVIEATPVEIVESVPAEAISVNPATETQNPTEIKALVPIQTFISNPTNEDEARIKEEMELKEKITNQMNSMKVIITRSTNGKNQQRVTGKRTYQNQYGHYYGTIGSKIDRLIEIGNFTKKEIEVYAGTKMSKVNSHIAHLRKDKGMNIVFTEKKKVKFADIEKPIAV
jgi:hypothetical protein